MTGRMLWVTKPHVMSFRMNNVFEKVKRSFRRENVEPKKQKKPSPFLNYAREEEEPTNHHFEKTAEEKLCQETARFF